MKRRKCDAVVAPYPHLQADLESEESCYMLMVLHHPWRAEGEWLIKYGSSIEAAQNTLLIAKPQIRDMVTRMQRMNDVMEDTRARHNATQNRDASAPNDEEYGLFDYNDMHLLRAQLPVNPPTSDTNWPHRKIYSAEEYNRAKTFVQEEKARWEQRYQDQLQAWAIEQDERAANYRDDPSLRPPSVELLNMEEALNNDQYIAYRTMRYHIETGVQFVGIVTGIHPPPPLLLIILCIDNY